MSERAPPMASSWTPPDSTELAGVGALSLLWDTAPSENLLEALDPLPRKKHTARPIHSQGPLDP